MTIDAVLDPRVILGRYPGAVLMGVSAAREWNGLDDEMAGRSYPVEFALERRVRPRDGLRARRVLLRPDEITQHGGVDLTTPLRTAFDVARQMSTVDAVVVVEALVRDHGVEPAEVRDMARQRAHERGVGRVPTALAYVEHEARNAFETRLRMALVAEGLPVPTVAYVPVHRPTGLPLGVTDLAWPVLRCAVLCDRDASTARLMARGLVADGWAIRSVTRPLFAAHPGTELLGIRLMLRSARQAAFPAEAEREKWPSRARRRSDVPRLYS